MLMSDLSRNVVRFSRDYRRPLRWGMGLPPRRPKRRLRLAGLFVGLTGTLALLALLFVVPLS
jgi:hypothetical protein